MALIRLPDGEDNEQVLAIAIETNKLIAELGVRLINSEFLSVRDDLFDKINAKAPRKACNTFSNIYFFAPLR